MPLAPATLRAARLAQGMSLATLAASSGVSAATLSRLENGSRDATDHETNVLARAIGVSVACLCRPLVSERLGLSGFYHRKLSRAGSREVNRIENQCLLDVVAIQSLLSMVETKHPERVLTINLDDAKGDPEQAANMARLAWQIPRGPIQDVCATVERAGCLVIHSDFGIPKMDALYQKARGVPPIFWTNSRKPMERIRWSVCHELGHLVLHEEEPIDDKLAEDQADAFAAAFLMPRSDFRGECPSRLWIPELIEMKRRWRCSMVAIARRARDVDRITEQQYTSIMVEMSRRGWRRIEPYPITGESPSLLRSTVETALLTCGLSEQELAECLAISTEQVRAWQQPFPGQRPAPDGDAAPRLRLANGF